MGNMKREDTISLLREILAACPSLVSASALNIVKEGEGWNLTVSWTPDAFDGNSLEKIVADRDLEVITSGERTVFYSKRQKS